jgi:hypothetical protein
MRVRKFWTEEEVARLRKLRSAGASAARAAIALKMSVQTVKTKARELGIPFDTISKMKKVQRAKERAARLKAGLPEKQDTYVRIAKPR